MVLDIVGLQISVPEFIWTIISFFLFKPVMTLMDERKARIDAGLEEGKKARAALEENEARLAQELAEKGSEARSVISEARSEAEKAKSETLDAAHAEAEKLHKNVRERVKAEEADAVKELDGNMPELVALLSGRLLGGEVSDEAALIENCIRETKE